MGGKRWLNIVVDGNIALRPYWSDIVSNYLEKIVRNFRGNIQEEEAYLGLVLYNANTELDEGYDIQFINWTTDVNKYLEKLSCLSFNGNDVNQYTMAEGLAEALVMYPKPSDIMTTSEYNNSERHCILVAQGDPTPRRMMLCCPMIKKFHVVSQRLKPRKADFLDVAQMFPLLHVSLSVITLNSLPIFGGIFNLGNNVLTLTNDPISDYSTSHINVLLSRNFQQAHDALQENRTMTLPSTRSVEPMSATTIPRVLTNNLQEDKAPSSSCEVAIEERINEASTIVRNELDFPNETNQTNVVLTSSSHSQMNVYADIMAEISTGKDIFAPSKRPKTFITLEGDNLKDLFEPDQQLLFDDVNKYSGQEHEQEMSTNKYVFMKALKAVETELEETLKDASLTTSNNKTSKVELTPSSSKEINIPLQEVQAHTSNNGEESSTGVFNGLASNKNVLNPILNSENSSNSAFLVPQQYPSSTRLAEQQTWYHQCGMMNTTNRLGTVDPWDPAQFTTEASCRNFTFPHEMGNSSMQFQPYSSPSQYPLEQHFPGHHMNPFGASNTPTFGASSLVPLLPDMTLTCYPPKNLSPPSLDDFQDYVHTWEGSLAGKIHSNRFSIIKAKAFRKATTPLTLTVRWTSRLEITHLVPQKAVNHTKKISYPMDYVFFHLVKFTNVDLYKHLKSTNLCAKIDLPFQSIILSPTKREHFFIGTVFPGDTLFIEPL